MELWLRSVIAELQKQEWSQSLGLGKAAGLGRGGQEKVQNDSRWEHKDLGQTWGEGTHGATGSEVRATKSPQGHRARDRNGV